MVKHILLFTRYFAPVYEASGPIQSVLGIANALSDRYRFSLVTSAYDPKKPRTYGEVTPNTWQDYQGIRIYYAAYGARGWNEMRARINETKPDLIYCQSVFELIFATLPFALVRLGAVSKIPRLISPRGEFNPGALAIRPWRKKAYLLLMKYLLLGRGTHVHATSETERDLAMKLLGLPASQVHVANNIKPLTPCTIPAPRKQAGMARFAYLGRIAPIKNLHIALELLAQQKGDIAFDIYGPLDKDDAYWKRCGKLMAALPANVKAINHGSVEPSQVSEQLRGAHFFLLPTAGENFGHAILEALNAGLPSIIGDQTPHLHDGTKAGWALPLSDKTAWEHAVAECIAMDQAAYDAAEAAAKNYAAQYHANSTAVQDHAAMFEAVMKA